MIKSNENNTLWFFKNKKITHFNMIGEKKKKKIYIKEKKKLVLYSCNGYLYN
ncbi:hypothetical protein PFMALIP_02737 [Plasmodium falciparum MaliPS096_E11]|uniref:Uncharacterized protein n=1 Tax=Plasmodium falciparum MaliPS096_E11 TaxID=1036727 RepID=A0A024WPS7_PLAFA|nr:hypothetical protein PFMALIP_02737 [Plasmodium falciparum MaliPS096_E11]